MPPVSDVSVNNPSAIAQQAAQAQAYVQGKGPPVSSSAKTNVGGYGGTGGSGGTSGSTRVQTPSSAIADAGAALAAATAAKEAQEQQAKSHGYNLLEEALNLPGYVVKGYAIGAVKLSAKQH